MIREPLEESYFNWLCAKVLTVRFPIYYDLMRILHNTEFVWVILGDKNRAEDGVELREDFLRETRLENDEDWFNEPCSVLEMLVAFAQKAKFQTDMPVSEWFWIFMTNLELDDYRRVHGRQKQIINDILYDFVYRTYLSNGQGGLFPMREPRQDQRKVEIWYQFCDWVDEQGLI